VPGSLRKPGNGQNCAEYQRTVKNGIALVCFTGQRQPNVATLNPPAITRRPAIAVPVRVQMTKRPPSRALFLGGGAESSLRWDLSISSWTRDPEPASPYRAAAPAAAPAPTAPA
jgi:hypothetical protein